MKTQLPDVAKYDIPGVLRFDETEQGLTRGTVNTAVCTAEFYLQGAHLTQWHPYGGKSVLFLSERAAIKPGVAIRGGVPIIFPWFGGRTTTQFSSRTDGPSHGFARTSVWQLAAAAMDGDDLQVAFVLEPDERSRSLGFDDFKLTYKLTIGIELVMQLVVENRSQNEMQFEEALHSYFMIGDARQIDIRGLANTEFLDKTDGSKRKSQKEESLRLTAETDRPYLNTQAEVKLDDPVFKRSITVGKQNSNTTVIWNPWSELSAKLSDMSPDGWMQMVCIESANVIENSVILAPGELHTMSVRVSVVDT